mmetsp:Transcript_2893/g.4026  ORF Transcript_2893/g.4026 Transcript_2893/m.4026 type:complete len:287 (+) Transcript_2893:45-905(+)|eukprot:CAMPEP_0170077276 /NCGR_PEP_ID=MMETSP0019_2-20121128/14125_1 /TAXON_ID=98059 /ORGANISM="Dinobryon sp., Strain UTEXLB2267" /LENGTH=286 /DNA_ID=CAMNT_0010289507 /DNA_START=44 /DNA_END=904 /DNA_ORIENTATION=+
MKRILVTGSNKGIGFAIVRRLLEDYNDTVLLLCSRDRIRGLEAVDSLVNERSSWAERLHFIPLDVNSVESVETAAKTVSSMFADDSTPLYGIVNNAAVGFGSSLSTTVATNVYGCRRVCESFLPLLNSAVGRIVFISSAAGPMFVAKCSPEKQAFFIKKNITWTEIDELIVSCCNTCSSVSDFAALGLGDGQFYGFSKACLNLYMKYLSNQYPHLRINSCTPGFIDTDLTKNFNVPGKKSTSEGTHAPVYLLMGDVVGNGRYYGSDCVRSPLDRYRNPGDAEYTSD